MRPLRTSFRGRIRSFVGTEVSRFGAVRCKGLADRPEAVVARFCFRNVALVGFAKAYQVFEVFFGADVPGLRFCPWSQRRADALVSKEMLHS